MYAIVDFKGFQFRAEVGKVLKVPYLACLEAGSEVEMDKILILEDDARKLYLGAPVVQNAKVVAEVLEHKRDKKIIVFHKKKRKGYAKKNGHRQYFTNIMVKNIVH